MNRLYVAKGSFPRFGLWGDMLQKGRVLGFDLEWTARCNNSCRHCYINLPASDAKAKAQELSLAEAKRIVDEAVKMGALWCLVTGGEPLLRPDFADLYLFLKKKGLLITLFTNATLVTEEHVRLFLKYPPKKIEVTDYGVTEETYERVTRRPGSFKAFRRGLDLLLNRGLNVRLKAMALRSNLHELPQIAAFCEEKTGAPFRFDPFLYLRLDGDQRRNREIQDERLSPAEIAGLEHQDPKRFPELQKWCAEMYAPEEPSSGCHHLFHCGAGIGEFAIGFDGYFRLCSALGHPHCIFDLRRGSLAEAWEVFSRKARGLKSTRKGFLDRCYQCPLVNLCMWCPGHSYLETGELDRPVDYFCEVAQARAELIQSGKIENCLRKVRAKNRPRGLQAERESR